MHRQRERFVTRERFHGLLAISNARQRPCISKKTPWQSNMKQSDKDLRLPLALCHGLNAGGMLSHSPSQNFTVSGEGTCIGIFQLWVPGPGIRAACGPHQHSKLSVCCRQHQPAISTQHPLGTDFRSGLSVNLSRCVC